MAIGTSAAVEVLEVLGFSVVKVPKILPRYYVEDIMGKILESKIAILEEEIYLQLREKLGQVLRMIRRPPMVIVVPSFEKPETGRLEELHNVVSLAVGVQLKWKK